MAARLGTVSIAVFMLAWASIQFPAFWRSADAERVAAAILGGRSFPSELVARLAAEVQTPDELGACRASARRAEALLQLYLYEDAFAASRMDLVDQRSKPLEASLQAALRCEPSDAYLWLVLFSIENAVLGFRPEHLQYLKMSYALGPHEGWIALKRTQVALAVFSALDSDLAAQVLAEFAALVDNDLYDEAASTFASANPATHARLLNALINVPAANRRRFSKALDRYLPFVPVPGVVREDGQPWKH